MGASHGFEQTSDDPGRSVSSRPSSWTYPKKQLEVSGRSWRGISNHIARQPSWQVFTRRLLMSSILLLMLFMQFIAPLPVVQPSIAFAQALQQANRPLSPPSWLTHIHAGKPVNLGKYVKPTKTGPQINEPHPWIVSMKSAKVALTTTTQRFVGSDGQLEVDIPAGSLNAVQLAQHSGGIFLYITQVKPGAGGLRSDHIFFGTYEFQFFDANGKALNSVSLLHPLTVFFHLQKDQQELVWSGQKVYALWSIVKGSATPPVVSPSYTRGVQTALVPQALTKQPPTLIYAQSDRSGLNWSIQSSLSTTATTSSPAAQASSITFGTQAPQANWSMPTDLQVGLNSGGLNYSYPFNLPPGPGGLQPALSLNYSSGSVNENHNPQSASPWVGQGWSLDMGSISWAQENVTPNGSATLENVWHINDPSGISGQLIPPDVTYSTDGATLNPSLSNLQNTSNVYIWQTAPFSHTKVREIAFGSYPCWQVYLPTGIMEEFGCTNDSRESYKDSQGNWDAYSWKLNLMTDRFGNQVHITYQPISVSGDVRDAVLQDISYDDPNCHNTSTACSSWVPHIDIHFDASQAVANRLNSGCGNGTAGQSRCDDPQDLSGSGGLPAPKVMSAYVLNDLKIEMQDNYNPSTYYTLHEYVFSYNQGGPQTITDPSTGQSESVSGYLTLGKIQEEGVGGAILNAPITTMQYTAVDQHYSDLFSDAIPTNNCSPYKGAPHDGSYCYLWSKSYNTYYLTNLDNGRGWNESISWQEAHANTWGVDGGAINDAFNCSSSQTSTNICGRADDKNWSRVVVASRTAVSNGVSSKWSYNYYLQMGVGASYPGHSTLSCSPSCSQTYDWGNQNDDDFADYYNGDFQSFYQVQVIQPDNSSQTMTYGATNGWGLYSSGIHCYVSGITCSVAPYNTSNGPVLAGKLLQEQDYDNGNPVHLLKQVNWNWTTNCPPPGVPGSQGAAGGSTDPGGNFLFSPLDRNNPVMVCDPRATTVKSYLTDGLSSVSDPNVVNTTTNYTFDGWNCGSNYKSGYDYGNVSKQDVTSNDAGSLHLINDTQTCPNDNISGSNSIYLTSLPAETQMEDGAGTIYGCHVNFYNGNSSFTVAPNQPDVTRTEDHTASSGGCTSPGQLIVTLHSFDAFGNAITATDPDTHFGCTSGSAMYSACATYDTLATHLLTATNAKNQTTTYDYDGDAGEAGYGQWLMSTTDVNGQTTTYQYDALGRLISITRPGDSTSSPTITYTYNNQCVSGKTAPCLEIDTSTRFTSGGPLSTMKQWYDGWGRLVETQTPGPNLFSKVPAIPSLLITYTIYDTMGRATTKSLTYAVAATAGLGYVAPNLNQPRTVTGYDSLGRPLGTVIYGNGSTIVQSSSISYTVAQGVATISSENNTPYERTTTLDSYNHQTISYTDGLGRTRYAQAFSGTGTYSVVRTVGKTYDVEGNTLSTITYDAAGTAQATYSAVYDGLKRLVGFNDSDLGSCRNTPMPADCGSSSDTAWKYTYDYDSNLLSQTDPRNQSTDTSFDALDLPLCSALTSGDASSCQGSTYATFFYDSYDNHGTPGATFPSGCTAPDGSYASDPIGRKTAELFTSASGAGSGWRCWGYDQRGQTDQSTLSVTTPSGGKTITQTVNMTYNDGGEVTTLLYPDSETLTVNYDTNGRVRSIYFGTTSTPDPVSFLIGQVIYANDGQQAGLAMGGSGSKTSIPPAVLTAATTYDSIQRPLSNSVVVGNQTLWSQTRSYDNVGNVLGLSTTVPTQSGSSATENEAFCYDALNRLAWAGNSGTPTGGDHCMTAPSGTTLTPYSQAYSYDSLDRLTSSAAGNYTYGDLNQLHAVTSVSSIPSQYAAYDAMGNMTCRNTDTSTAHTCASGSPNGAQLSYDVEGRLVSWTAPSGTSGSENDLYDNEGHRVFTHATSSAGTVNTVYFDGYTDTVIKSGTTTTTTYYSANGQRVAVRVGTGATLDYLVSDPLGSNTVAFNDVGQVIALQHYSPYGTGDYSWGTMPTTYNYATQRLDSQTGLLYDTFRFYDPLIGRFTRADTVETNAGGMDPYAYVGDNPESKNDPSGHIIVGQNGNFGHIDANGYVTSDTYAYDGWKWDYNTSTEVQRPIYNPDTDPNNSPVAKFSHVTGWSDLSSTWSNPHATWQDKTAAVWNFLGTNANNVFQLAMIFGGGEEEGAVFGGETLFKDVAESGMVTLVNDTKVTLYRAIGETELNDLLKFGDYGLSPNQSGKYFALTEQGMIDFAKSSFNEGRQMTLTSTNIPSSWLEKGFQFFDSGGAGQSVHFSDEVLIELYQVMELPHIWDLP